MKESTTASAVTWKCSHQSLRRRPQWRRRSGSQMKVRRGLCFYGTINCYDIWLTARCCSQQVVKVCLRCLLLQKVVHRRCLSATCATTPALRTSGWGTTGAFITLTNLIGELWKKTCAINTHSLCGASAGRAFYFLCRLIAKIWVCLFVFKERNKKCPASCPMTPEVTPGTEGWIQMNKWDMRRDE